MIPIMERPPTAEELAEAERELSDVEQKTSNPPLVPMHLLVRERALRNRLENLLADGLEASFTSIVAAAAKVGCFDEVTRLLARAISETIAGTKDEDLKRELARISDPLLEANPLRPEEIAAEPPAVWIGHTMCTQWQPKNPPEILRKPEIWHFAFNPPSGYDFFAPEALIVWPPLPSITIDAVRIGRYDVESWKAVHAAEVPFGSTVALACRFNPISLAGIPVFGTTAAGQQMELQLGIEDARDVDRIAVLVRGVPIDPLRKGK